MNRHLNFVTLICLITGFVSLASCSNDDDEMDKYQKIYIRTGVAPGAEMGAAVVVDCVSNSSTADRSDFEIQLCAVQPVTRDATAALVVDTLKVDTSILPIRRNVSCCPKIIIPLKQVKLS